MRNEKCEINCRVVKLIATLREILKSGDFEQQFEIAAFANEWFTIEDIVRARDAIVEEFLDQARVARWLGKYQEGLQDQRVCIVMAGNIPMVGFFDMFCTLLTNNYAIIKPSSKDSVLIGYIAEKLAGAGFGVELCDKIPDNVQKLLTMGGEQAAQFYGTKFAQPLIRSHRSSIAIISQNDDPVGINDDMFLYWGLGCRNVSFLYLPMGYELERLPYFTTDFKPFRDNYLYQKALHTINGTSFTDRGYLLRESSPRVKQPLAVVGYSFYDTIDEIMVEEDRIQCVACNHPPEKFPRQTPIGTTQRPTLTDYPDGKDIIEYLLTRH